MELFGVKLIGVNSQVGEKLIFTAIMLVSLGLLRVVVQWLAQHIFAGRGQSRARFWTRQSTNILTTVLGVVALLSIWFDKPQNLGIAIGLLTAGLAFALQKVILALAGYFVTLRGSIFRVGDRITMGGVRGDVIALDFLFTTVMEMGEPAPAQGDATASWVAARQYTGRIVSISNASIFEQPVFNYSRDFPYIWEEIHIPVAYSCDRLQAERILLEAANRHTETVAQMSAASVESMLVQYAIPIEDLQPRVFYRITDNWLELALRFLARDREIRILKDAITRDILTGFDKADIQVASSTYDIVGLPPLRFERGAEGPESGS